MKLILPKKYSQNNPLWKNKALGTQGTIGQYGCLISCVAMVSTYFGHDENPDKINTYLTHNNGYVNGNLYIWNAVAKKYPDMVYQGIVRTPDTLTKTQMDAIRSIIDQGFPLFLKIDVIPSTSKLDEHWVLGTDYDGDDIIIQDPWDGAEKRITSWGVAPQKIIYGYGYYSGHLPVFIEETIHAESRESDSGLIATNADSPSARISAIQSAYQNLQSQYALLENKYITLKKQIDDNNNPIATNPLEVKYNELETIVKSIQNNAVSINSSTKSAIQSKKVIVGMSSNILSFGLILFQTSQIKPGDDWKSISIKLLGAALTAFGISNVASQYVKSQGLIDTAALAENTNK